MTPTELAIGSSCAGGGQCLSRTTCDPLSNECSEYSYYITFVTPTPMGCLQYNMDICDMDIYVITPMDSFGFQSLTLKTFKVEDLESVVYIYIYIAYW